VLLGAICALSVGARVFHLDIPSEHIPDQGFIFDQKYCVNAAQVIAGVTPTSAYRGAATTESRTDKGLDNRSRDENGEIRTKRDDTTFRSLRQTYGVDFAPGTRSDAQLRTVLKNAGQPWLSQYLKTGRGR
jgi:hypothetical protein